jgi:hypothetical protein
MGKSTVNGGSFHSYVNVYQRGNNFVDWLEGVVLLYGFLGQNEGPGGPQMAYDA